MDKNNKTINIITLGCSKNVVDTEHLMGQLAHNGCNVVYERPIEEADTVVINTCGFTLDAKEESVETILQYAYAKREGMISRLYVIGCLSERYADDLRAEIPEVDSFFGVNSLADIITAVAGESKEVLYGERKLTTPSHYAYLKISEGCNWGCGYCAIPLIRGSHKSVEMPLLIEEATSLAKSGVKELIVIAQDTTFYGMDLYGERKLGELLRMLCKIDGIEWIRLHYTYPTKFPMDVIEAIAEEPKICKYIDIPFQHISDNMLSSMRRGISKAETIALIETLRERIPSIVIRTTLIVGYPGESLQDYNELREFVESQKFDRLGVFTYSKEDGTYSALNLKDNVPAKEKERRRSEIMKIQAEISLNNNTQKLLNTSQKVIIDGIEGEFYVGRTQYDSPEVDQEVLIQSNTLLKKGSFYTAHIYNVDMYDLYAIVEE